MRKAHETRNSADQRSEYYAQHSEISRSDRSRADDFENRVRSCERIRDLPPRRDADERPNVHDRDEVYGATEKETEWSLSFRIQKKWTNSVSMTTGNHIFPVTPRPRPPPPPPPHTHTHTHTVVLYRLTT